MTKRVRCELCNKKGPKDQKESFICKECSYDPEIIEPKQIKLSDKINV